MLYNFLIIIAYTINNRFLVLKIEQQTPPTL